MTENPHTQPIENGRLAREATARAQRAAIIAMFDPEHIDNIVSVPDSIRAQVIAEYAKVHGHDPVAVLVAVADGLERLAAVEAARVETARRAYGWPAR